MLPTLAALRAHATEIAEQVVAENAGKWERARERDLERVDALARAIVNRLLHEPTARLKELHDDRVHARMALIRDLFGLEVESDAAERRARPASGRGPPRTPAPRSRRARLVDPDRDARQRARARAGGVGRAIGAAVESYAIVDDRRRGPVGDKSRWVVGARAGAAGRARSMSPCTRPRTFPAELADGLALVADSGARGSARRALRRVVVVRACAGSAGRHELPAAGGADPRVRDDLEVVELRGNVDTRLRKLAAGECDALVLAVAGLARLGRLDAVDGMLDELVPAAGQGALAVEARPGRASAVSGLVDADATRLRHGRARADARAGRLVQHAGRRARPGGSRTASRADGWVGRPDGSVWIRDRLCGRPADGLGARGRASGCCAARRGGAAVVTVYLVGAGPGDPGLMTARALELIAAADVIVYDRLIPPARSPGARPDAELIYAGKEGGGPSMPQAEITRLLVDHGVAGALGRAA